jgi:hypothetical protein
LEAVMWAAVMWAKVLRAEPPLAEASGAWVVADVLAAKLS